jgi:Mlc titration factor MtfA (ptsG expression regulator)
MFGWFKKRRRKKLLAQPWPEAWSLHLNRNVRLTWKLSEPEMAGLQKRTRVFVAEKNWEGCDGLVVTEEMQVTIAAQASLLLLGVEDFYFDNVRSILIFPRAFQRQVNDGGVQATQHRAGEAWQGGPIILSWQDTLTGGRNEDDGRNLVIHEFAHALDGLDGEMGGEIVFESPEDAQNWKTTIASEYKTLCLAKEQGTRTLLDHYGATNHAEFFAVASETFFEQPIRLANEHADLFVLLKKYYKVDPTSLVQSR